MELNGGGASGNADTSPVTAGNDALSAKEGGLSIGAFIRSQREAAQVSLRQLAQMAGVSNPYLSQIERGLRKPSAEVLAQIARGLRLSSEALYVRAGYLEPHNYGPVRDALLADSAITERQRQVLLDIYESFCRENAKAASEGEGADAVTDGD